MPNKFWTIPQIWDGDSCVIVGGGPSLRGLDVETLRPFRVIAVNCAYRMSQRFEVMFYGDRHWLHDHGRELVHFPGLKITSMPEYRSDPWIDSLGIKVVKRDSNAYGISTNPALLSWNQSSGACAINLAVLLGASEIILLGFDMQRVNGKMNYHSEYPDHDIAFDPFYNFLPAFGAIAAHLKSLGIQCLNATPGSALKAFPFVDLKDIRC